VSRTPSILLVDHDAATRDTMQSELQRMELAV
jgi:hypothetical protein